MSQITFATHLQSILEKRQFSPKIVWPATFHFPNHTTLYLHLITEKSDAQAITHKLVHHIEELQKQLSTTAEIELDFNEEIQTLYQNFQTLSQRKSYRPFSLAGILIDEDSGQLALLSWRAKIILKRNNKTGILLQQSAPNQEIAVRLGQINCDDTLIIMNNLDDLKNDEQLTQTWIENFSVARNWLEFTLFARSHFEQNKTVGASLIILAAKKSLHSAENDQNKEKNGSFSEENLNISHHENDKYNEKINTDETNSDNIENKTSDELDTAVPSFLSPSSSSKPNILNKFSQLWRKKTISSTKKSETESTQTETENETFSPSQETNDSSFTDQNL